MKSQNKSSKSRNLPIKWLFGFFFALTLALAQGGYLTPAINYLNSDEMSFKFGANEVSLYVILKAIITIVTLFWAASVFSDSCERRIRKFMNGQKESNKTLAIKLFQGILYFSVILIILDVIGIDITHFAVFSGALGIGIGFGLQKISSNFISGIILLFEKSVEVNDLIELNDGAVGFIRSTGARYTLIETFDGREVMVPNEDFITNRVINWTYSNKKGRIDIKVGVSYNSDLKQVYQLMLDAAYEYPCCSKATSPECYLVEFADSSVNFELYFWVDDIVSGRKRAHSDVLFSIWNKFKQHNIEIPFPQQDIHIKTKG